MRIGSEEHKRLFCESFMESHRIYEPEQIPLPQLDTATLDRLRSIPFWDEALYTERKAGKMLDAFSERVEDIQIREAIALQGREEARHGRLIQYLLNHYAIEIPQRPEREIPADLEPAFVKFGYGECFDSFFAFGLFAIARQAGLMPEDFFTLFDPILDEEARHMVFFVNWIAYQQVQAGRDWLRPANSLWQYTGALQRRLDNLPISKKKKKSSNKKGFTATGVKSFTLNLTLEQFLQTCIEENARRMSVYNQQLLRPEFLPALAGVALHTLRLLPKRQGESWAEDARG
ncbi:ferritin-like domain-containing protein [Kovacikia minuta CCNUW1]|uniref:ferritin-like domain-containing protein n=1 Tax=Kovacikia minuta TaxID=2931930 RepID=UPI001CCC94BD|nr:ferritin-like domain-containing protein [Kovacikia minuta]UBF24912.1 ferritin-like domain-containing protein [Kovacikia minuta CCNUW1]